MTTKEIAYRLVELSRKGDFEKAQKELFSDNAVSMEPYATPAFEKETKGLKAIKEKGDKWNSMVQQMNSLIVSDPLVASNSFACTMQMNVIIKDRGQLDINELCVYQVKDGEIISEQFYM